MRILCKPSIRRAMTWTACLFLLLSTSSPALAQDPNPTWKTEWEKTVQAAKEEGQVVIYAGHPFRLYYALLTEFENDFPGLKVKFEPGRGSLLGPKLLAERRAGKYLTDIVISGKGTSFGTLYPARVLQPIKPNLMLPDVVDQSNWWQSKHRYLDPEDELIFVFVGNAGEVNIAYNKDQVDPNEFKSYRDLLNPKWKGKITAMDPRMRGADTPLLFFYYMPALGPEFMKQLYGEMNVTISRSYRQPIDWLAKGRFSLCIPCPATEVGDAIEQGLPLGEIGALKEGSTLSSGGHTLMFVKNAPHPNSARVFINWLLSRKGQSIMQTVKGVPHRSRPNSLRIDVSKADLPKDRLRITARVYFDGDNPKYVDRRPADRLLDKVFRK